MTPSELAAEAHDALTNARSIAPFSARGVRPTEAEAYQAAAHLRDLRGARVVGRKIGFTNRNIWPLYNITQPIDRICLVIRMLLARIIYKAYVII